MPFIQPTSAQIEFLNDASVSAGLRAAILAAVAVGAWIKPFHAFPTVERIEIDGVPVAQRAALIANGMWQASENPYQFAWSKNGVGPRFQNSVALKNNQGYTFDAVSGLMVPTNISQLLATSIVDGAAKTAAAAASVIPAGAIATIPAAELAVGSRLRIRFGGLISSVITTPGTFRFDVRIGGLVVFDSLAILLDTVAAHVNRAFFAGVDLTVRAVGVGTTTFMPSNAFFASEDIVAAATQPAGAGGYATLPWNASPAAAGAVDSTIANTLDLFHTQTVATGSVTVQVYSADLTPPQ